LSTLLKYLAYRHKIIRAGCHSARPHEFFFTLIN
jgi:hypothetical protein